MKNKVTPLPLSIAVPYSPDDCHDEYGWLWATVPPRRGEWHLVSTWLPDGIDADPMIRFHSPHDGDHPFGEDHADEWAGAPYIPCSPPPCSAQAGAMVRVYLPGGGITTVTCEDLDAKAQAMTDAVIAVLVEDPHAL